MAVFALIAVRLIGGETKTSGGDGSTVWIIADYDHALPQGVAKSGDPAVVESPYGKALYFDGKDDALFFPSNALSGLREFTIEVIFRPDSDGPKEQRFLHFGYAEGDRVLLETRVTDDGQWYLDTFVKSGDFGKALIDPERLHPADQWHHVAYVLKEGQLRNYVNGTLELEGEVVFEPMEGGAQSLGVRLNRVYWFKGAVYQVRVTAKALSPDGFLDWRR